MTTEVQKLTKETHLVNNGCDVKEVKLKNTKYLVADENSPSFDFDLKEVSSSSSKQQKSSSPIRKIKYFCDWKESSKQPSDATLTDEDLSFDNKTPSGQIENCDHKSFLSTQFSLFQNFFSRISESREISIPIIKKNSKSISSHENKKSQPNDSKKNLSNLTKKNSKTFKSASLLSSIFTSHKMYSPFKESKKDDCFRTEHISEKYVKPKEQSSFNTFTENQSKIIKDLNNVFASGSLFPIQKNRQLSGLNSFTYLERFHFRRDLPPAPGHFHKIEHEYDSMFNNSLQPALLLSEE